MPSSVLRTEDSAPKKGFLRSLFTAAVPGALAAGTLMIGLPPEIAGVCGAGAATGVALGSFLGGGGYLEGLETAFTSGSGAVAAAAAAAAISVPAGAVAAAGAAVIGGLVSAEVAVGCDPPPHFSLNNEPHLDFTRVFAGTLVGASLSAMVILGAVFDHTSPEKIVPPTSASPVIEQAIPESSVLLNSALNNMNSTISNMNSAISSASMNRGPR